MNDNLPSKPKQPLFLYAIVLVLGFLIIQTFLPTTFGAEKPTEVTYSEFLSMLDEEKILDVSINEENRRIDFTAMGEDKDNKDKEIEIEYFTGYTPNEALLVHLAAAKNPDGDPLTYTNVPRETASFWQSLLYTMLPMGVLIIGSIVLFRFMSKRMNGENMNFGKSNAKMYVKTQTDVTFADVAGQDEAKEDLREIVDFLHNPAKYKAVGAKMPKGALLVGPPGTGKTLLAKAVAGEAGVPFFSISGSAFVEMFVGRGAARVRDLFKDAAAKAPCIVFIDELDTIGKKRDGGMGTGSNDEREQTLNQLLSEMDGFDGGNGIIILAATNRPEVLDSALLRPGRFDRRIPVELPDLKGREEILIVHAKKIVLDDSNIDYKFVARITSGTSGADLANIINEGALRAVKHNRRVVTQEDLVESVETVIAGQQRKNKVINQKEKEIVAYHEIGHALVAVKQKHTAPVTKITIVPRTSGALGFTMQADEEETNLMSKEEAQNNITTLAGGRSAEEVKFGIITTGASSDIEKMTKTARAMITRYGMSDKFDMMALETQGSQYLTGESQLICGPETAAQIDLEVLGIIKTAHNKAKQILTDNYALLDKLSQFLLEKESITGDEFMAAIKEHEESAGKGLGTEVKDLIKDFGSAESSEGSKLGL